MRPVFIFLLSVFFITAQAQQAQLVLQGVVTDASTHQPIPGATVYLPDLKKGAVADLDGKFSIEKLSRGKFLVEVKYIGYATHVQRVEIQEDLHLNFSLGSTITELNEVVISGISHSTELKKNPVAVATVSTEAL